MAVNDFKPSNQFIFDLNVCFPSIPVHPHYFGVKNPLQDQSLAQFEDKIALLPLTDSDGL